MNLFYASGITEQECTLGEEEAKHALRVLRLSEGDEIQLTDGKGKGFSGVIASSDVTSCKVEITGTLPVQNKRSCEVHIGIAPTKNNSRFEWFLEKAGEIGIDAITPIICEHSERRHIQVERLEKILIGAMKQSQQFILPILNPIIGMEDFLSGFAADSKNTFIASHKEGNKELADVCNAGKDTTVLIGPEGDFSAAEISMAKERDIESINLGITRLRTETAGLVAVHTLTLINNGE